MIKERWKSTFNLGDKCEVEYLWHCWVVDKTDTQVAIDNNDIWPISHSEPLWGDISTMLVIMKWSFNDKLIPQKKLEIKLIKILKKKTDGKSIISSWHHFVFCFRVWLGSAGMCDARWRGDEGDCSVTESDSSWNLRADARVVWKRQPHEKWKWEGRGI